MGGGVIASPAVSRDGSCRYTLVAREPASGKSLWKKDGYDIRTASGAGCEQRRDPGGSGGVLVATRGDNRDVFLSVSTGSELWVAAPGESILATDGRYGLVRSADHKAVKEVDLTNGQVQWSQPAPAHAAVALTPYAVFVGDFDNDHLLAVDPVSRRVLLDLKTGSTLLGYGSTGVVLNLGRTIGYLAYG
jgi:hypothetical protein